MSENEKKPLIDESIFGSDLLTPKTSPEQTDWEESYRSAMNHSDHAADNVMDDMTNFTAGNITDNRTEDTNSFRNQILPKKSSDKPMMIALFLLFILLIGLCVYIAVSISKGFANLHVKKDVTYESETGDPWEEILGEDQTDDANGADDGGAADKDYDANIWNKRLTDPESDSWKDAFVNHEASEFKGPYYEEFVDCIDETVSYKVERNFEEINDKKYDSCLRVSYVQLDGDIPNLDEINRILKDKAMDEFEAYKDNEAQYHEIIKEYGTCVDVLVQSFVTYNDEEIISVAIQKDSRLGMDAEMGFETVNVNLVTGTVMDNTQILNLQDSFGEEFRQRSNKQNGTSQLVEMMSNIEIVDRLNDEESLIVFYTPIGMEVGFHYKGNGFSGWVTVSMTDYEKYLNKM